jgi:hypothetical protein
MGERCYAYVASKCYVQKKLMTCVNNVALYDGTSNTHAWVGFEEGHGVGWRVVYFDKVKKVQW